MKKQQSIQHWSNIDWGNVVTYVNKKQQQIQNCYKEESFDQVMQLQLQLFLSFEARALAVRTVTSNKLFKKEPGVDGVIWNTSKKKISAVHALFAYYGDCKDSLDTSVYKVDALLDFELPEKKGIKVSLPTMEDRAMQQLFVYVLDPIVQLTIDPHAYGYRKDTTAAGAIKELKALLKDTKTNKLIQQLHVFHKLDTTHANHYLLDNLVIFHDKPLREWLKQDMPIFNTMVTFNKGRAPQAQPIAALFCEIVFKNLEDSVRNRLSNHKHLFRNHKQVDHYLKIIRYGHHLVIVGTLEALRLNKDWIGLCLKQRGFYLTWKKAPPMSYLINGFNFLGHTFKSGTDKQYTIHKPASASLKVTRLKILL